MELRINSTVKDAQKNITRNDDFLRKGNDNMNKQSLINNGYKHICTQNSKSKIELWARFNGYKDTIVYLYYNPETDMVLEQTRQTITYTQLDMMAQMRDKMREDFLKLDVEYDKENIWQGEAVRHEIEWLKEEYNELL